MNTPKNWTDIDGADIGNDNAHDPEAEAREALSDAGDNDPAFGPSRRRDPEAPDYERED